MIISGYKKHNFSFSQSYDTWYIGRGQLLLHVLLALWLMTLVQNFGIEKRSGVWKILRSAFLDPFILILFLQDTSYKISS